MDETAHCAALVREADRIRFLADLYAPEPVRGDLFALHAFDAEIGAIPARVTEPLAGEIRLQWWRDALGSAEKAAGHPVALALGRAIERHRLPVEAFAAYLDARIGDLYADPMPTVGDVEGYAGETESALLRLGCLILGDDGTTGTADICGHGGVALVMTSALERLGSSARRGRSILPSDLLAGHGIEPAAIADAGKASLSAAARDLAEAADGHLGRALAHLPDVPAAILPALLPLAVVPARLKRVKERSDPFLPSGVSPWATQWAIWRAARRWPGLMR